MQSRSFAGWISLIFFVALVGGSTAPSRADLTLRPSGEHGVQITTGNKIAEQRLNPALLEQSAAGSGVRLKDGEEKSNVPIGQMLVTVTANPLKVRVADQKGRLVQELEFGERGSISFLLGDGPVLGLGEGADQFDRRGANYRLINGQRDRLATLGTRVFSPFLLGTSGWAMFIASPYGGIDLRGERGVFTPQAGSESGGAGVIVIDAKEPADAMREFSRLTGAAAMPPKWALGYMQSHRTLASESDVLAEAREFRRRNFRAI